MEDASQLSVVIASIAPEPVLRRCLESIVPQSANAEIVVASAADGAAHNLTREFPHVRLVSAQPGTNLFSLRTLGVAASTGTVVVLTEDHCTAAAGWLNNLRNAVTNDHPIVGGAVDNGETSRVLDWALFFCEYLWLLPPLPTGPLRVALGVNIAYRRALLEQCRDTWREAFYENEVQDALQRAGHSPHAAPLARVLSHLQMPFRDALVHFYRGGRRFGRHRVAQARQRQWLRCLTAPLIPPVLLQRMARTITQRDSSYLGRFCRSLPVVLCFTGAWALGEAVGYASSPSNRG